jgi:hypothetical protein
MVVAFRQVWTWSLVEVDIVDIMLEVMGGYLGVLRRIRKSDGPGSAVQVVLIIRWFL